VLGPVVRLWRATGDERFLDFARFVAARLEGESGPRVASSLRAGRGVHEVANGKAYEMLSVLCGRLDLARATGEEEIADAATVAFEDIVKHHLYVTGGLSFEEYFRAPATAPSTGDVSETCALVTWMQLCAELFKLTGERRFLAPFERAAWNHLLAAQRPDGAAFCYFTPLAGRRIHRTDLTCCGSSGPRGLALVPQLIFAVRAPSQVEVHLLIDAHAKLAIEGGHAELTLSTNFVSPAPDDYPRRAKLVASTTAACDLVVHAPTWARRVTFHGSAPRRLEGGADDAFRVRLEPGAARNFSLEVHELASRFEMGRGRESGRQARLLGPLVLARSAGSGEVARPDGTRELPHVPFFMPSPDESPLAVWQEPAS